MAQVYEEKERERGSKEERKEERNGGRETRCVSATNSLDIAHEIIIFYLGRFMN